MKIQCKCTRFELYNQTRQIAFTVDNVRPTDILVDILRDSGKTLEDISFRKYYKYCAEEGSCIEMLPYIVRDKKYVWEEYTENVTVQEFMETHGLSPDNPIEVETFCPCGAGGVEDIILLWEALWPYIEKVVELMGIVVTVTEFFQIIKKCLYCRTSEEDDDVEENIISPNTLFDAIYKQNAWTTVELADKVDISTDMAKCFLDLLGYTWNRHTQCYTITEEKKEEKFAELNKAQQIAKENRLTS